MNHKMVRYIIGMILASEAAFMLLPVLICLFYGEYQTVPAFLYSMAATAVAALLLGIRKPENDTIFSKESFVSVSLGWILISVFGALPFCFSGAIPNLVDCIFETVSGFTTTGATIIDSVEILPKGILFWRAFTHWIGGMGVLVFLLILTQLSEGHSMYIMRAEVPGPSVGKLTPKARSNSLILYGIYTALTVIEAVILVAEGLPVFDSVTTAMSTAGTGGFGVRDAGIVVYGAAAEWTVGLFELLFGVNFNLYFLLLVRRFKQAFASEELKVYLGIIAVTTIAIACNVTPYYGTFAEAVRKAFFQVVSTITTTGFSGVSFMEWPMFSKTIILFLLFTGACAGSTAGGIKMSRLIITSKILYSSAHQMAHPHEVYSIKFEDKQVDKETRSFITIYMTTFFALLFLVTFIVMSCGYDLETSFTSVLSCFNNVGPAMGLIGHSGNYNFFSPLIKILLSMMMLIGRLEIFPILILFMPSTWKKH